MRGRPPRGEQGGDPPGGSSLCRVGVEDVCAGAASRCAGARVPRWRPRAGDSSRCSAGRRTTGTPSSWATYSIDSSPSASVPATTTTSWPRARCRAASSMTCNAAPPTFSRAIACTIEQPLLCRRAHPAVAGLPGACAPPARERAPTRPNVSQKSAAIGVPPKSAEPAIAPTSDASHGRGQVRRELVGVARTASRAPDRHGVAPACTSRARNSAMPTMPSS